MTFIQILIILSEALIFFYAVVDKVCQCIEHCATARAYSGFRKIGMLIKMDDIGGGIVKNQKSIFKLGL